MKIILSIVALVAIVLAIVVLNPFQDESRILIFSKTAGYHHDSISAGQLALMKMASEYGFRADTTTDSRIFRDDVLASYKTVVFLSTTLDVLNETEQIAFQRFIEAGGGYAGIHSASDTEYDWPWYGQLVGGYFTGHPAIQEATLRVEEADHPSTVDLPTEWVRTDEWYNIRSVNPDVHVLLAIDETTYNTGKDTAPSYHPMSWYHEFDGGRSFYTALGHTEESYSDPLFLQHVWSGIEWAAGNPEALDYARERVTPDPSAFRFTVLKDSLNEPMELDLLPDGRILFAERRGKIQLFDPSSRESSVAASIDVFSELEDGILGLAVAPDFSTTHWIYVYYSPVGEEPVQNLSRFKFADDRLDLETEQVLLQVRKQRLECCHSGGSVEFGPDGLLYLSVGDDTNPFASDGFDPIDEGRGRAQWDAQRTSGNSQDLRGKILRIRPEMDGSYSIPEGNLFPADGVDGRPEIYVMGNRNPFRISIDQKTSTLYWGEVGPDASRDSVGRGPKGHDEINRTTTAGFFGWPYFVGNNKAYNDYDFVRSSSGPPFDATAPTNNSPNNTGLKNLPPARPAFIWYPYDASVEFPMMGEGGRTAMAGPVYYGPTESGSAAAFPAYYHGKLFIYEWMRHFIKVVTMDEQGGYRYMESFLPGTTLSRPMDMVFAPDGSLFMLEYGPNWNALNAEARLTHIEYIGK